MRDTERKALGGIHDALADNLMTLAVYLDNTDKSQPMYHELVHAFRSMVQLKGDIRELCREVRK